MIVRILDTATNRPYTVQADSIGEAVLTLAKTTGVRTFNTAILEAGERVKADPLATDRTLVQGEVIRGLTDGERSALSADPECGFTAEVFRLAS